MAGPNLEELAAQYGGKVDTGQDLDALASQYGGKSVKEGLKPSGANAGLLNFAASAVGLPVDTVENAINLGIAGYGAIKGAITGDGGASPEPLKNSFGGSESIKNALRGTGQPLMSPDNPNPEDKLGTVAYEFVSRGGAIPGGALPAAGSMIAEKIGGPQWAGVGALAPSAAVQAYNAARATGLAEKQKQNVVRDESAKAGMDAGYKLPPSRLNPNVGNKIIEGVAGKDALRYETEHANQQVTNKLARQAIGMPEDAPITPQALELKRKEFSEPYKKISSISPIADEALQKLRDFRAEATAYWKHYDTTADPNSQRVAKHFDEKAKSAERYLDQLARNVGKPELIPELREARANIAKTYDIERALNLGNGNVDARVIGRALDRGRPLTDQLKTIAKFSEAFPQFTREASKVPTPQLGRLDHAAAGALALGGFSTMGPYGVAAAAIPYAAGPARSALLSDSYQSNFARPSYSPGMQPAIPARLAAQLGMIESQK